MFPKRHRQSVPLWEQPVRQLREFHTRSDGLAPEQLIHNRHCLSQNHSLQRSLQTNCNVVPLPCHAQPFQGMAGPVRMLKDACTL